MYKEDAKSPPVAPAKKGMPTPLKILLWCVGIVVVGFFGLAAIGSQLPESKMTQSERIKASCAREYPGDEEAANSCAIRLMVEALQKQEGDRMKRAASGAGL